MNTTPLTDHQLDQITTRAEAVKDWGHPASDDEHLGVLSWARLETFSSDQKSPRYTKRSIELDAGILAALLSAPQDVTALLAQVRRLSGRVAELEAYAYGCDGEGCVLPHSSWCETAKKTAAANNGCTCPRPWEGHPQPHAAYCWLVSPPRPEVEEMRKRIAELTANTTAGSNR